MDVIVAGKLPLPPSVNEMYGFDEETGKRYMTATGKEWKEEIFSILDYGGVEEPYAVFINAQKVAEIREIYANKSRAKVVLDQRKFYRFEVMFIFRNERGGDADNRNKILQDTIFDWIREKRDGLSGLPFDDRRVVNPVIYRLVDASVPQPYVEFSLQECSITWKAGDIWTKALKSTQKLPDIDLFWQAHTENVPAIDMSQTIKLPVVRAPKVRHPAH